MNTRCNSPVPHIYVTHFQIAMKRVTEYNESLDTPPAKRQFAPESPIVALSKRAPREVVRATIPATTRSICRFLDDGYIDALIKRHRTDARYRKYFRDHDVEDIRKIMRSYLSPGLLKSSTMAKRQML